MIVLLKLSSNKGVCMGGRCGCQGEIYFNHVTARDLITNRLESGNIFNVYTLHIHHAAGAGTEAAHSGRALRTVHKIVSIGSTKHSKLIRVINYTISSLMRFF